MKNNEESTEWNYVMPDGAIIQRSHTEYTILQENNKQLKLNSWMSLGIVMLLLITIFIGILILTGTGIIGQVLRNGVC